MSFRGKIVSYWDTTGNIREEMTTSTAGYEDLLYNEGGKLTQKRTYGLDKAPITVIFYYYDSNGSRTMMIDMSDVKAPVLEMTTTKYDDKGNWTEQVTWKPSYGKDGNMATDKDGKPAFNPALATYREIQYAGK